MTRSRIIDAVTVVIVCLLGGVVLCGIGTPVIASIAIAVLAAAATAFTRWAHAHYARMRGDQRNR